MDEEINLLMFLLIAVLFVCLEDECVWVIVSIGVEFESEDTDVLARLVSIENDTIL